MEFMLLKLKFIVHKGISFLNLVKYFSIFICHIKGQIDVLINSNTLFYSNAIHFFAFVQL